jgi:hypothetical protein
MPQSELFDSLKYQIWNCHSFFDLERREAAFLHEYRTHQALKSLNRYVTARMRQNTMDTFNAKNVEIGLTQLYENLSGLESILRERKVSYSINFVLVSEAPQFEALLTKEEKEFIQNGIRTVLNRLHRMAPQYRNEIWSFDAADYFDPVHLNEGGLQKLGKKICTLNLVR